MPSLKFPLFALRIRLSAALFLLLPGIAFAQTAAKQTAAAGGTPEQRAARAYDAARANPLDLYGFLRSMPKGSDLHYHQEGGIYAESWIRAGAEDGLCINLARH